MLAFNGAYYFECFLTFHILNIFGLPYSLLISSWHWGLKANPAHIYVKLFFLFHNRIYNGAKTFISLLAELKLFIFHLISVS